MRRMLINPLAFVLLLSGFALAAGVPNSINYQGRLTTPAGTPVAVNLASSGSSH